MANLIPLEQAAAILGMTVEQITELRSNNEIFGYRDGASWKFKQAELERVAADLDLKIDMDAMKSALQSGSDSDLGLKESDSALNLISDDDSSADIIDDDSSSEGDLIEEDSSVEIFSKPLGAAEEALGLSDSGLNLEESVDDLKLHDSGEGVTDEDDDLAFGSSDLSLAAESSKKLAGSDDVLDDFEESKGSPSDTGKMLGDDDDMLLSEEDLFSDELSIADSGSFEDSAELSSDFEDSDLVMEDSDSSTEVALEANESGINLSPNESGILLEEDSLELGGSDIDSLELPEDDDEIIMLEDPADADAATVMQVDDFNLTPLEEAMEDESTGSQVIALEDSEIYADESSATILAESNELVAEPAMLEDSLGFDADAYGTAGLAPAGMAAPGTAAMPEAPYTVWQVVSLGLVAGLLAIGAMIAYDLARNMWMPDDQVLGSGILKMFLDLVGMG